MEVKGEQRHQEVQDLFKEFMLPLNLLFKDYLKEGWCLLEERYLSHVTLVLLGGMIDLRSLLCREVVA